jgi:hypothetical protein
MTSDRERAWNAVHDALPAGWHVGPTGNDPGIARWQVAARSDVHGRGKIPEYVIGSAVDEVGALVDLALRLGERRKAAHLATIDENGRRAFLEGAAEEWQRANGRPPTRDELRRMLARYSR